MKLSGKIAIVTGAASGIGRATALMMALEGARVVVADINASGLDETARLIVSEGGQAVACVTDVARASDVERMVRCAVDVYGGLHILHNNAYWLALGPVCDLEETGWDRTLDVCLKALYLGSKFAIPVMKTSGGGAIVNTASVHSHVAFRNYAAYDAAKGGVIGLTRSIAIDYGPYVRANAVLPGAILTAAWDGTTDADRVPFVARCPMKRLGQPEDIAAAVVFLSSDAASFITGTCLVVDGGLTIVGDP
ncbi:MAG: SDR family oxidoreductase [candidate division Zixibacteria bacterium]|nr:SDR family oxidoreductase [candidate division Zixibacteria bacterium]